LSAPLLEIRNVSRHFGAFAALSDVSLAVEAGVPTALIGPNGAGKTTFYNVVSGRFPPTHGRILLDGRDVTGVPARRLVGMGLARAFQITNVFPSLTVRENVLVPLVLEAGHGRRMLRSMARERDLARRAEETLAEVGLGALADRTVATLAYGDRRLVEIAIVLARRPRLVLLDEPTAGMNPEETDRMIALVRGLAERLGTTFFVTEHDMRVVFGLARRIHVLHQGALLAAGTPEEIRADARVREAYLGAEELADD
jgi:branched-chain amino acid transport system ATP-binding protein